MGARGSAERNGEGFCFVSRVHNASVLFFSAGRSALVMRADLSAVADYYGLSAVESKSFWINAAEAIAKSQWRHYFLFGLRMLGRWAFSGEGRRRPFEFLGKHFPRTRQPAITD